MTSTTTPPLILASNSPRRQALLKELELSFEIVVRPVAEDLPPDFAAEEAAEHLARRKAAAYLDLSETHIVITADTTVVLDRKLLEKPANRAEAIEMIGKLSGRMHEVISGFCLLYKGELRSFSASTRVYFRALGEEEIAHYVDTYQPFDKAGAYGIQEWIGMVGIEKIEGDYYNVVGLPVRKLYRELSVLRKEIQQEK